MLLASQFSAKSKKLFVFTSPFFFTTRLKGGRHERGFGLFLKELNMDSLNRRLESYCLQTTEALAYWMSLMHLPPTLPSWARSEASIFFPTQNFKIRKGRRSCCEILRYPLGLGAKLLFFSQLKSLRSERDVVAVARFPTSNRSNPTTVLTGTKSPHTDDCLPIGYSLPDFQLI